MLQYAILPLNHLFEISHILLDDAGNQTSGNGPASLTDVDTLASLNSNWVVQSSNHLDVVTRHDHLGVSVLGTLGEEEGTGLVGSSDVHLGAVVLQETGVSATFLLGKDVQGDHELGVCLDAAGLDDDHAALDVLSADTTQEQTGVVTGAGLVAGLLEGLNVGDLGLDDLTSLANKLDLAVLLQHSTLDTARGNGTTAGNGEDILDGHQEGLLQVTLGRGDPLINSLEQLIDLLLADLDTLVLEGAQGRAQDDGGLVTLKSVGCQQLTHLHLDELQHLRVLQSIDLVDKDDNPLDTDLTRQQQVLSCLGHLTIGGGDNDDGAIHVGGTSNHVLNVIGVTRAVDVGVVTGLGGILDVGSGDGDATLSLFGSLVDGAIVEEVCETLLGLSLCDGGRECCLSVIDVTDCANVDVRLASLKDGVSSAQVQDGRSRLLLQRY